LDVTRTVDGVAEQQHVENQLDCTSIRTVLETRDAQRSRERHEIERCVHRSGDDERTLLPPGAVVLVTRTYRDEGPSSVELEGGTLSDEDREALGLATPLSRQSADADFGTDEPQPVGGSWPASEGACRINGADAPDCQTRGTVTVASREQVGDVVALWIEADVRGDGTTTLGDDGEVPAAFTTNIRARHLLPVDVALEELRSEDVIDMELRGTVPPEGERTSPMELVMRSRFEVVASYEDPT
jgi:hypothetical protein